MGRSGQDAGEKSCGDHLQPGPCFLQHACLLEKVTGGWRPMSDLLPPVHRPQLDPSSLLEERSETPIVFVVSFVLSATPQTGGNGQGI